MLVFVPLAPADLADWAATGKRTVSGFAATPAFLESCGLSHPDRADADQTLREGAEFGAVVADCVRWKAVESLFVDDEAGAARAASVKDAIGPATLDEAWDCDEVSDLLRGTELLWHGSSEWARLSH